MIQANAAAFSSALMDICNEVDGNVEMVIRKACFDLYAMIVKRTPVDTGRAKGSWGIGTEHSPDFLPPGDYGDTVEMVGEATMGAFTFHVEDSQVIIYNNLDYIEKLESGDGSKQAPEGMVAISLAEFEAHFRNALSTSTVLK